MEKILNPVLSGFHPDPSILRVGCDYYIATSTFEWFPGVRIHHSRDLIHWHPVAAPLKSKKQLDMIGNPSSCGIWAPCLSYSGGLYYLIYTDVKSHYGIFKDTHNYLVTASSITGEWSEPVKLNSSGFDPSLFHDDDGKKWLVNMLWDHRNGRNRFGGILLQEYSEDGECLIGEPVNIFKGTEAGFTEGPHLYRHNGLYYLMTAEGGTSYNHCVTVARSEKITGPYEADPEGPMLTSWDDPHAALQKAGHGSLVETQNGEWYLAHLCSRPLPPKGRSILGRETCLQKVNWTSDGWPRLEDGGNKPSVSVPAPALPLCPWEKKPSRDDFNSEALDIDFQTLRIPLGEDMLSLKERPGYLRLKGAESLSSLFRQSLVSKRQQSFKYQAGTCLEFEPCNFQQMAGLICLYDTMNYYYLHITFDEKLGKCINILSCKNKSEAYPLGDGIPIGNAHRCGMRVQVFDDRLQFSYSPDEAQWKDIGPVLDASTMSDEHFWYIGEERFTGAFVGMCCQDLSGLSLHADFDYFEYIDI